MRRLSLQREVHVREELEEALRRALELREEEYRRIHSEEGKKLRMNRSIQAEGGFADIKGDSGFTRFLCKGNENVFAEYILYAMAHNLGWLHSRIQNDKLDLHLYELKEDETEAA